MDAIAINQKTAPKSLHDVADAAPEHDIKLSMSSPRLSAVICVVDPHPKYFREAVLSVLNQTFRDFELLIIEEPSGRRVVDVLDAINDPRIRHFCHPHRTSLVEQRNRGLANATTEFVALMDADDACMPERFQKQLSYLESHPEIAVLGTQLEIIDPEGRTIGYRRYPTDNEAILKSLPIFDPIAQPSVMLRKKAVADAGGYQYVKHKFVEDYELWCRMAKMGFRFANFPEPLLRYRVHPAGAKTASLHTSLKGTIDVKKMYFLGSLGLRGRFRLFAERMLFLLPKSFVISLFLTLNVRRKP